MSKARLAIACIAVGYIAGSLFAAAGRTTVARATGWCLLASLFLLIRLGIAETYDVIVRPQEEKAYTIFAQPESRGSYARGTLAPRMGMTTEIPPMDPEPEFTYVPLRVA